MSKTTDIRTAVEAELKFDPLVDDADVHVVNMNGKRHEGHRLLAEDRIGLADGPAWPGRPMRARSRQVRWQPDVAGHNLGWNLIPPSKRTTSALR
jgi:hypothetical protein